MSRYQIVTLLHAICVAASLVGVGISIGQRSLPGIVTCLVAATLIMGSGFRYKRKHLK
jgi:hypothetical protein